MELIKPLKRCIKYFSWNLNVEERRYYLTLNFAFHLVANYENKHDKDIIYNLFSALFEYTIYNVCIQICCVIYYHMTQIKQSPYSTRINAKRPRKELFKSYLGTS